MGYSQIQKESNEHPAEQFIAKKAVRHSSNKINPDIFGDKEVSKYHPVTNLATKKFLQCDYGHQHAEDKIKTKIEKIQTHNLATLLTAH